MEKTNSTISIIGAGNMGFRLGIAFAEKGWNVSAVYNRNRETGEKLTRALIRNGSETVYCDTISAVPETDITIISVSDDFIENAAKEYGKTHPGSKTALLHTSGATSLSVLSVSGCRYGVIYPLMTLSKIKSIDFSIVPFLLETDDESVKEKEIALIKSLGAEYKFVDSEKRLDMHTSAVFCCNFVSYMLGLAFDLVKDNPVFMMPLATETVRKFFLMLDPDATITGPARRADMKTIERHLQVLADKKMDEHYEVYRFLTDKILEKYHKK